MNRREARVVLTVATLVAVVVGAQAASAAGIGLRSSRLTTFDAPVTLTRTSTPEETTTTTESPTTTSPETTTTTPGPAQPPQPVQVALAAVADSYVSRSQSTTAFGAATPLLVRGGTGQAKHAFVRFDLTSIPAGSTVQSTTLTLHRTDASAATFTASRVTGAWAEPTLTWATAPTVAGTGHTASSSAASITWSSAALVADVADMLAEPAGNHGWRITHGANTDLGLRSREADTSPPTLVVTYVAP